MYGYADISVRYIGFHCFEQRSRGEGSVSAADIQLRLLLVLVRVALPRRCARNGRVIARTILLAEYRVHPAVPPRTAYTPRYLPVEKPERLGSARLGCALRGCSLPMGSGGASPLSAQRSIGSAHSVDRCQPKGALWHARARYCATNAWLQECCTPRACVRAAAYHCALSGEATASAVSAASQ